MIANLERTQSNAQQYKNKHRTPTTNEEAQQTTDQRQQNYCLGTDSNLSLLFISSFICLGDDALIS